MVNSGIYSAHPQLQGKFTSLTVEGIYSADGEQLDGRGKAGRKATRSRFSAITIHSSMTAMARPPQGK